jgi:hypothetical protein
LLLPLRRRMIALFLHQQPPGLLSAQVFALLTQGLTLAAHDLAIRHLPLQLLIGDHAVAGELVDSIMLVQVLEIVLYFSMGYRGPHSD